MDSLAGRWVAALAGPAALPPAPALSSLSRSSSQAGRGPRACGRAAVEAAIRCLSFRSNSAWSTTGAVPGGTGLRGGGRSARPPTGTANLSRTRAPGRGAGSGASAGAAPSCLRSSSWEGPRGAPPRVSPLDGGGPLGRVGQSVFFSTVGTHLEADERGGPAGHEAGSSRAPPPFLRLFLRLFLLPQKPPLVLQLLQPALLRNGPLPLFLLPLLALLGGEPLPLLLLLALLVGEPLVLAGLAPALLQEAAQGGGGGRRRLGAHRLGLEGGLEEAEAELDQALLLLQLLLLRPPLHPPRLPRLVGAKGASVPRRPARGGRSSGA